VYSESTGSRLVNPRLQFVGGLVAGIAWQAKESGLRDLVSSSSGEYLFCVVRPHE
jgi:hypothetical protein